MAKPKKADNASLTKAATEALHVLLDNDFATGAQEQVKARFADVPPKALALVLLKAFWTMLGRYLPPEPHTLTAMAGLLVYVCGLEEARQAVEADCDGSAEHLFLAEQLGMVPDFGEALPAGLRDFMGSQVPELRGQIAGSRGPAALVQALLELPQVIRQPGLELLVADAKPTLAMQAFAALVALSPFSAAEKRLAVEWLVQQNSPESRAFLAKLPETAVDSDTYVLARRALMRQGTAKPPAAKKLPGVPLDWPVIEAYASTIDGQGSQGLYLVRRISPRKVAVIGAVCNDLRGIADGIQVPEAPQAEASDLLSALQSGEVAIAPVPADYVTQRIRAGIEQAHSLSLPLPHEFRLGHYLLAGLAPGEPIDVMALAKSWADPARLADTHYLIHTLAGRSWYFEDADGLLPEAFFAAGDKALQRLPQKQGTLSVPPEIAREADAPDGLLLWLQREGFLADPIAAQAERLFSASLRWRWCRRLAEMAYWFDHAGKSTMRTLAATAALAMDPTSGVPLPDQPLPGAMLRASLLVRYE